MIATQSGSIDAVESFAGIGEKYKAEIIARIPSNEPLSLYRYEFIDLCCGPQCCPRQALRPSFAMEQAGAYWRGGMRKNEMLQRIYGNGLGHQGRTEASPHYKKRPSALSDCKIGCELDLF